MSIVRGAFREKPQNEDQNHDDEEYQESSEQEEHEEGCAEKEVAGQSYGGRHHTRYRPLRSWPHLGQ